MIVTRKWLEEWVDLSGITLEQICAKLNSIGLEVERVHSYNIPKGVVVGRVLECTDHVDAKKLSVCKVDVGDTVLQIVCGASNVKADQYVGVAVVGAVLDNALEIKPVELRGVSSHGMICSASELGLTMNADGILELDDSIGELIVGRELCEYETLCDDLIEIELTANRGDCLSIRGVARDLGAAFERKLKKPTIKLQDECNSHRAIGRAVRLQSDLNINANLEFFVVDLDSLVVDLLVAFRVGLLGLATDKFSKIETLLRYSMHDVGVIMRSYDLEFFKDEQDKMATIYLRSIEDGLIGVCSHKEQASTVGVSQQNSSKVTTQSKLALIESSYIDPEVICEIVVKNKIECDELYYNVSRGSESDLSFGSKALFALFAKKDTCRVYSGSLTHMDTAQTKIIQLEMGYIRSLIGVDIEQSKVMSILTDLSLDVSKSSGEHLVVSVPRFRHDIHNRQDIVEEIVRMIGIDNIDSKPLSMQESSSLDSEYIKYKKRIEYRHRAASLGFFETIHFVFSERVGLQRYGFECVDPDLELLNPIANTLDTLRPTLLYNLLQAASLNAKNSYRKIALFEIGSVFDYERQESVKMALLLSGEIESDTLLNSGKPDQVEFSHLATICSNIFGDITLVEHRASHKIAHLYQSAQIIQNGMVIGEIFKLHPAIESELGLGSTLLCEVDFNLLKYDLVVAKEYSRFQPSFRDLSICVPKQMSYRRIRSTIDESGSRYITRHYIVDRYSDENMGDQMSLTLRFVLQSQEKTLSEDDITQDIQSVLDELKKRLGAELR